MTDDEVLTEDAKRAYEIARKVSHSTAERATIAAGIIQAMAINRLAQVIQDREE